jgi:hypothetical protein
VVVHGKQRARVHSKSPEGEAPDCAVAVKYALSVSHLCDVSCCVTPRRELVSRPESDSASESSTPLARHGWKYG